MILGGNVAKTKPQFVRTWPVQVNLHQLQMEAVCFCQNHVYWEHNNQFNNQEVFNPIIIHLCCVNSQK